MSNDSTITTIDDMPEIVTKKKLSKVGAHETAAGRIDLMINASEGEAGGQAVFIGHNTETYHVPRGIWVSVPVEVVGVLDDCVMSQYMSNELGQTVERQVKRFSYNTRPSV